MRVFYGNEPQPLAPFVAPRFGMGWRIDIYDRMSGELLTTLIHRTNLVTIIGSGGCQINFGERGIERSAIYTRLTCGPNCEHELEAARIAKAFGGPILYHITA